MAHKEYYRLVLINTYYEKLEIDKARLSNYLQENYFAYDEINDIYRSYQRADSEFYLKIRSDIPSEYLKERTVPTDYLELDIEHNKNDVFTLKIAFDLAQELCRIFNLSIFDPLTRTHIYKESYLLLHEAYYNLFDRLKTEKPYMIAPILGEFYFASDHGKGSVYKKTIGDFNYAFGIIITGEIREAIYNNIVVSDHPVFITDKPLALFLRLVLALKTTKNGYIHKIDLIRERLLTEKGFYQSISRLKQPFRLSVGNDIPEFDVEKFFERRPEEIRISNRPELIKLNREKLLQHPDLLIVKLAKQLKE